MAFSRGRILKPRNLQKAKATSLWPQLSVYCLCTSMSVQCRRTPSIMDATSEQEYRLNCE